MQALIQQEKDLDKQIKNLQIQLEQTVPDKNHLKQLEQKVKELEKGLYMLCRPCHTIQFFLHLATQFYS